MEMPGVARFADKARARYPVIYFAVHGLEVDGTNYVVPVTPCWNATRMSMTKPSPQPILLAAERRRSWAGHPGCLSRQSVREEMKRTISSRHWGVAYRRRGDQANTFIAVCRKGGIDRRDAMAGQPVFRRAAQHLTWPGLDIRKALASSGTTWMSAYRQPAEPYTTNSLGGNDVALVPLPRRRRGERERQRRHSPRL